MSFHFTATLPTDQAALAEFLQTTFHAGGEAVSFRPEVLQWKYFAPHPEWSGPRSYLLRENGRLVSHGGVWPVNLASASAKLRTIHLIDWAASPSAPGTGVQLLRKIAEAGDLLLTIGGSADTQAILPRLGAKCLGTFRMYARVVRPWLQFRTSPAGNWRAPLRFLRNAAWSLSRLPAAPKAWEVARTSQFDSSIEPILDEAPSDSLCSRRTVSGLNRMLSCPAARFSAFQLLQSQTLAGYFLLSQVGRQARIVDLRVRDEDPECLVHACSLALRTAAGESQTCEIVAGSSSGRVHRALEKSGFLLRQEEPIYGYDPRTLLSPDTALELTLLDGDACFMSDPRNPYLM